MVTQIAYQDTEILCSGIKAVPDTDEWKELLEKAKGAKIDVTVYTENNDKWTQHKPFSIEISPDSINPYISYRLIPPSYVTYEKLTINQRCLENFDESVIYDNMLCSSEGKEQCINCHSYQNYNPDKMQFHARQHKGGTLLVTTDGVKKINLKTDSQHLFRYTAAVIERLGLLVEVQNDDIYGSGFADEVLSVKTAYESKFVAMGLPITYTRFGLGDCTNFEYFDWEGDDVLEKDAESNRTKAF